MAEGGIVRKLKITDLDDNCLIQLCEYFDHVDLVNLFKTNRGFHVAIKHVVENREYLLKIDSDDPEKDMENITEFLEMFGSLVRRLSTSIKIKRVTKKYSFERNALDDFFQSQIIRYCAPGRLTHFTLGFNCANDFFETNAAIFSSLHTLDYRYKHFGYEAMRILDSLPNLRHFIFNIYVYRSNLVFERFARLPLEKCHSVRINRDAVIETDRIPINRTMTDLAIHDEQHSHFILEKFPNLVNLDLNIDFTVLYGLSETLNTLQNLRSFTVMSHYVYDEKDYNNAMVRFLSGMRDSNQLEELNLLDPEIDGVDMTNELKQMSNLRKLTVSRNLADGPHLNELAVNLQRLTHFTLKFYWSHYTSDRRPVSRQQITNTLNFVQMRTTLTCLNLDFPAEIKGFNNEQFFKDVINIRRHQKNDKILYVNIFYDCNSSNKLSRRRRSMYDVYVRMDIYTA